MNDNIKISKKLPRVNEYTYKENFREFIDYYCGKYANDVAFIIKEIRETKTVSAQYRYISFQEFAHDVYAFSAFLSANS